MEDKFKTFWIGIGCQKGVSNKLIETAVVRVCDRYNISLDEIAGVATLDLKANEPGLVEFCRDRNLPLVAFPAQLLNTIEVLNSSQLVATKTATYSVAEAAAILASKSDLIVPKQIVKITGEKGGVTVAIA